MRFIARITSILLTCLLISACGDTRGVGDYVLDAQHFSKTMAAKLVSMGKIPSHRESEARDRFADSVFNIELKPDHSFRVVQYMGNASHTYKGTWSLNGSSFKMIQTHTDNKPSHDQLVGTLKGSTIVVTGREEDLEFTMRLTRKSSPAAAPK